MSDAKNTEIREIDLLPDVHKEVVKMYSYMKEKHPGRLWMAKLQMDHWDDICTAHERGKKLILTSTNTPAELIYAFDAVPFVPETLIMRYANSDKTFKYLDLADQYVSHQLCSINRGQIGYYLSGDLRMKPDAILATVTPCDSSRVAYTAAAKILDIPSFCLDTPYRQDERGYGYLAEQLKEACKFLE
jgi:benzoyl-CoA reductase/2-hydroxyglutaryl-CoA dehydratase subunit BcrC/BadD/HgdB